MRCNEDCMVAVSKHFGLSEYERTDVGAYLCIREILMIRRTNKGSRDENLPNIHILMEELLAEEEMESSFLDVLENEIGEERLKEIVDFYESLRKE